MLPSRCATICRRGRCCGVYDCGVARAVLLKDKIRAVERKSLGLTDRLIRLRDHEAGGVAGCAGTNAVVIALPGPGIALGTGEVASAQG